MKKKHKIIGISAVFAVITVYLLASYIGGGSKELVKNDNEDIYVQEESEGTNDKENEKEEIANVSSKDNLIVVEVKGEVKNPSVYYVKEGCIIEDLIKEAGGLTESADTTSINRAEEVTNHQCIIIPNINDKNAENTESSGVSAPSVDSNNDKVNINKASSEELQTLNGIGEAKAAAIIEYRESNGNFKSIEELTNVSGIGEASLEKIKEKITI